MRGDFGVTSLAIILGIIMAVISLNFVFLINDSVCFGLDVSCRFVPV